MPALTVILTLLTCPAGACARPDPWEVRAELPGGCSGGYLWQSAVVAEEERFTREHPARVVVGVAGCSEGDPT
jgi:hypothetical protein